MLKWRLTDEAQEDMKNIRVFTKQYWGAAQSIRYSKIIREKIDLLAQNPRLGTDRSAELGKGVRSILIGSHSIYYEFNAKWLTILAILHQAMTPAEHLRQK